MKKKFIYLTYEIFRREFDSKILMAIIAATRGYHVVLGDLREDIDFNLPEGFYFHKDHGVGADKRFKRWKKNNAIIGSLDEEGLITGNLDWYQRVRINKVALDLSDFVFLWGKHQRSLFNENTLIDDNFVVTGHPRFDLLKREDFSVNKVTKILVNTRFTKANPMGTFDHLVNVWKKSGYINSLDEENALIEERDKEKFILDEFHHFINSSLKETSEVKITLRCHPAESEEYYKELYKNEPRVIVDRDTPLFQQLRNSDVVLHDGCTTGIEAASLGVPVVGLRPKIENYDYGEFANQFSLNFESHQALHQYIFNDFNMVDFSQLYDQVSHSTLEMINNWKGGGAINKILDTISQVELKLVDIHELMKVKEKVIIKKLLLKNYYKVIGRLLGVKISSLGVKKLGLYLNELKMVEELSPEVSIKEIKERVSMILNICNLKFKTDDFIFHKLSNKSVIISLR